MLQLFLIGGGVGGGLALWAAWTAAAGLLEGRVLSDTRRPQTAWMFATGAGLGALAYEGEVSLLFSGVA